MGIVISVAGKVGGYLVNSTAEKIREDVVPRIQEHVGYVTDYASNMKLLKTEVDKLGVIQNDVQRSVDEAKNNGQSIAPGLGSLLKKADRTKEEVKKIFDETTKRWLGGWCPDPLSRYKLSKEAKMKTQHVIGLQVEIIWSNFADFQSRMSTMKEIMAALKDDNIHAIGICGFGGVGKTTTVQKICRRAKVEKLFDAIVMVLVSQKQDVKKIQEEIAKKLKLTLDKRELPERAETLRVGLMNGEKRVLVILDDVWEWLDLKEVGIPIGGAYKGCKVMLTSRSKDVFTMMGISSNFPIGLLSEQEAWNLFKGKAGNCIDSPDLNRIAKEVVKECGGLPIAIVTVGTALRGKDERVWKNALGQLKKANPENIPGMEKYVYQTIKLSYDFLDSEAKSFLLLCCLNEEDSFTKKEEDSDIWFTQLVRYGMGLGLFKGIDALADAEDRVHTLIDRLKGFYLLSDDSEKGWVKVHDVVRDVIRFIARQGKEVFKYGDGREVKEWLTENMDEQYTTLSLISNKVDYLPELLQLTIHTSKSPIAPDDLFEGMKELRVLRLGGVAFLPSPPRSLTLLTKLRTLYLCECQLEDISIIGELKTLVILSFHNSSLKELPREIGNLTHLNMLDLTNCELERISPGVISSLKRLKELYLRNSGVQWVVEEGKGENTVNLAQLLSLSKLTHLETFLPNAKFPRSNNLFENLVRFGIFIEDGEGGPWSREDVFQNELELHLDTGIPIDGWINVLLKKTEILRLTLRGAKNVLNDIMSLENLLKLKSLRLHNCEGLEYLIDIVDLVLDDIFPNLESLEIISVSNLKMICHGKHLAMLFRELRRLDLRSLPELMHLWKNPTEVVSLCNLSHVEVEECHKLENLFSQSTASGLEQLEVLQIQNCKMIEEIITMEKGEQGETITNKLSFPKLSELRLVNLPNLIGFCKKMDEIEFPQLSTLFLQNLPELSNFCPNILASNGNHDGATQHLFNEKVKSMCELRCLRVDKCNKLLNVFSSNLVQSLRNLEELTIKYCDSLEVVFDFEGINIEDGRATLGLNCLKELEFTSLPKLTHLWKELPLGIQGFQNLRLLEVRACWSLKSIFTPSIAENLLKLEELHVSDCAITEIVGKDQDSRAENEEATKVIVFRQLKQLHLKNLANLVSFGPKPYTFEWPILEELSVNNSNMKVFIPSILGTRKQRTIDVRSHEEVHEQQIIFPRLEELTLGGNVEGILDGQLLAHSFCNLRHIHVVESNELLVIPSNWLPGLQTLEKLTIENCASLVEVFEERDAVLLPMLKNLELEGLPKLKHLFIEKLLFPSCLFQNLKFLDVWMCDNLRNLFSPSMARALVHLENLIIGSLEMMEQIVVEGENEEVYRTDKIVLPQLQCLRLDSLPNLTSFCESPYVFDLPLLEDVRVHNCPKMKAFSFGNLSTPNLQEVRVRDYPVEYFWMGDLNNTIQEHFQRNRKELGVDQEIGQQEHLVKVSEVKQEIEQEEHLIEELKVNQEVGYEEHLDDNDDDREN